MRGKEAEMSLNRKLRTQKEEREQKSERNLINGRCTEIEMIIIVTRIYKDSKFV